MRVSVRERCRSAASYIVPVHLQAEILQLDLFCHLKTVMMRRKDAGLRRMHMLSYERLGCHCLQEEMRPQSLKKFQHACNLHKNQQALLRTYHIDQRRVPQNGFQDASVASWAGEARTSKEPAAPKAQAVASIKL